jgi:hypothetical protein
MSQIVGQQSVDELDDSSSMIARGDQVAVLFHFGQGVFDSHGHAAAIQKRVVVFRVADADNPIAGDLQLA